MVDRNALGTRLFPYAEDRSSVVITDVPDDYHAQATAAKALASLRRHRKVTTAVWSSTVVAVAVAAVGIVVARPFVYWAAVTAFVLAAVGLVVRRRHRRELEETIAQVDREFGVPVPAELKSTVQTASNWFRMILATYDHIERAYSDLSKGPLARDPDYRSGVVAALRQVDTPTLVFLHVQFLRTFQALRQAWLDGDAEQWRAIAQGMSMLTELAHIEFDYTAGAEGAAGSP